MMHEKWEYAFMIFIDLAATSYTKEVKTALHIGSIRMAAEPGRSLDFLLYPNRKKKWEHVVFRALYDISHSLCKLRPQSHRRFVWRYDEQMIY